jgi:imidazolonepropionase-like amidohydrolase
MKLKRVLAGVALLALGAPLLADAPGVYAIAGGTVHPVSGPAIADGVVVIRDGLIEAVGANVAVPADATVVDAKGKHVYPGLIDAQTSLGFPSATPARRGRGGPPRPQSAATEQLPETSPAFLAMREAKLSDDDVDAKRATGVTTILTVPSFGIFNGQSVVLDLGGGTMEQRVVRNGATQQVSFNPRPAWTYPDSLMGVISYIRQSMFDAQHYAAAHAIYDKNPAGSPRPSESPALTALGGVLRRDVPVVFVADSELMMRRAIAIAREFNLRYALSGARQSYRMPADLKDVPVLVSVKWPVAPTAKEDREEQPLRLIRERQLAPTSPSVLQKSGVLFALVSGAGKTGDFLPGIRKAIDNGLSADDALRAVTLSPARILGVDRQLGSLEKGKIANVVVSDKPIFEKEAKVQRVFVDGREMKLPSEEDRARGRRGAGEAGAGPLDGSWSLIVKASTGDININARFHVEDGRVSGTFSGDRGSGDILNGTFDGTTLEFTINARQQAEQDAWVFHGTLRGTTIDGTVATTLGTLPFSGSKSR